MCIVLKTTIFDLVFFSSFDNISGPNGGHPFRTLGIGQRPFLDSSFSSHLRDLETFRRKATPLTSIPAPNSNATVHSTSSTNGLINSDCQGYKPNAPQIQGKQK